MLKLFLNYLTISFFFTYNINAQVNIEIDNALTFQSIYGFGATTGALVYGTKDNLTPELRERALDAVYNQVKLNTGNLSFGVFETPRSTTDTWGERRNDDNDPFQYEPSGFNWLGINNMYNKLIYPTQPMGFNDFYPANSISMRWEQIWLTDIKNTDYQRFLDECGEHVSAGLHYWRDSLNLPLKYMMLFNEPTSGNVELTGGTAQTVTDVIKAVGSRLEQEGFDDVKFVVPGEETEERSLQVATTILDDPEARKFVGAIAYHTYPYGSIYSSIPNILATSGAGKPNQGRIQVRHQLRDLAAQYNLPLWMTEVSHGYVDPRGMDDLRGRAIHIHDEFIYANASAYFGMSNMWDMISQKGHFGNTDLYSEEGTIVLIDNDSNKVTISGIGYAIGHYARWITPGSARIAAISGDSLVQVTAYRDESKKRLVFVVINNSEVDKSISLNIKNAIISGEVAGEKSFGDKRWKEIAPIPVSSQSGFEESLPPQSVSSFAVNFSMDNTGITKEPTVKYQGKSMIEIYPNPASYYVEITVGTNSSRQTAGGRQEREIRIYNIYGECVMMVEQTPLSVHRIDVAHLPNGIYTIVIQNSMEMRTKNFIILH